MLTAGQLDRVVQQRSVTAPHHALPRCHETARFVFARIAFPIGLGAMKAEQNLGNGPVALAALARVEGAQCQSMQFPELIWDRPKRAARRPAVKSAPQSPRRMRAQLEQPIERQSQGIGSDGVRRLLDKPELMDDLARAPHAMPAIVGTPQIESREDASGRPAIAADPRAGDAADNSTASGCKLGIQNINSRSAGSNGLRGKS